MAAQVANMAQVMKFNQAAFQKLAVAQAPIQVLPTQNDGFDSPPGFVLVMEGAYAADLRQGQRTKRRLYFLSQPRLPKTNPALAAGRR